MINTDLLPDAPVCSKLVMGYKAFTVTNTANTASMNRLTVAADGELAIIGTNVLVHNFGFNCWVIILAEVCGGHVRPTVGAGFCPPVLP